jgi:hypothetical protein
MELVSNSVCHCFITTKLNTVSGMARLNRDVSKYRNWERYCPYSRVSHEILNNIDS